MFYYYFKKITFDIYTQQKFKNTNKKLRPPWSQGNIIRITIQPWKSRGSIPLGEESGG